MAELQRKIKPFIKKALIEKAGNKCANPGCSNWRVHIHHIKHWAVYKTHEHADMIAVCPSCHDSAHYGALQISDEILYSWKGIVRNKFPDIAHLYVEPATDLKILVGTICLATKGDKALIFNLSNSNSLSLRILDNDLLLLNASIKDENGVQILKVVENNIRTFGNDGIRFEHRPGRAHVALRNDVKFLPDWMIRQVRYQEPTFASDRYLTVLDLEVIKPGVVKVKGCWPNGKVGVIITDRALAFCRFGNREPISILGDGEDSVLVFDGEISTAMFAVG